MFPWLNHKCIYCLKPFGFISWFTNCYEVEPGKHAHERCPVEPKAGA